MFYKSFQQLCSLDAILGTLLVSPIEMLAHKGGWEVGKENEGAWECSFPRKPGSFMEADGLLGLENCFCEKRLRPTRFLDNSGQCFWVFVAPLEDLGATSPQLHAN